jgi:glycerol-3-phosphate dehydrogenase
VVIGAGVVGAAIARELSRSQMRCALIEAGNDVGVGTSKANTALLHTGFDAKPGTLEARLVRRGFELLGAYAAEVGIPVERTGALLVAWSEEQLGEFPGIVERAHANGYRAIARVDPDELYRREPHLGPGALGALEVPDESIICPFTTPIAFATEAVMSGCHLRLRTTVTGLSRLDDGGFRVLTDRGDLGADLVINAAGLRSDDVDRMAGFDRFTVTPRRGELLVFDKLARPLIEHILLAVPTATTKGVLVAPTVFGNILVGPTAEDVDRKDDTSSTREGIDRLLAEAGRILPGLGAHDVTAIYVGLRAATESSDYQMHVHAPEGYACVGGIRSTGLSASMAIAEHVRRQLQEAGMRLEPKRTVPAVRMPQLGERSPRPFARPDAIAQDPEYGRIVCFCERVTAGEIRDATQAPIPAVDLDGLRRRTRSTMGRCQGFFCGAAIAAVLPSPSPPRAASGNDGAGGRGTLP